MARAEERFVELAEEIVARIEETEGPEWWADVSQLAEELETIRQPIGFPVWTYNDPESPAFFIAEVYPDCELDGLAAEMEDHLKRPLEKPGSKLSAYGEMLTRDPRAESYEFTMLWHKMRDEPRRIYSPDTAKIAIVTLRRWIRAISHIETISSPSDAVVKAIRESGDPVGTSNGIGKGTQPSTLKRGRPADPETKKQRKTVAGYWAFFKDNYSDLGYSRGSIEHFCQWACTKHDDMPSDNPVEIRKILDAYRKRSE